MLAGKERRCSVCKTFRRKNGVSFLVFFLAGCAGGGAQSKRHTEGVDPRYALRVQLGSVRYGAGPSLSPHRLLGDCGPACLFTRLSTSSPGGASARLETVRSSRE